jgi:hypothetical protein
MWDENFSIDQDFKTKMTSVNSSTKTDDKSTPVKTEANETENSHTWHAIVCQETDRRIVNVHGKEIIIEE